jgi:hypothetical protein
MLLTLSVALLSVPGAVLAQTPPPPAPPTIESVLDRPDITVAQAEKDIQQGRFRLFTYGLMRASHRGVAETLQKDFGIKHEMAAGCIVSSKLVERVRAYNERMEKAIRKKFGKSSRELYEAAERKYQQSKAI